MTIPKGTIWQELRAASLDAIPAETRVAFSAPRSMNIWRREGYYKVTGAMRKTITLVGAGDSFGAALLSDAEHLLDNAAEHHASLFQVTKFDTWLSPAWAAVTIYYWGFYAALALTRLLGHTVWFLDNDAIKDFKRLSSAQGNGLGPGAFRLECQGYISATDRVITLEREDGRLHEALWRQTGRRLQQAAKTATTNTEEQQLYSAIAAAAKKFGEDWPSAVRNIVNYRPGCGYKEVLLQGQIDTIRYLKTASRFSIEKLIDAFGSQICAINANADIAKNPAANCRLLLQYSLVLHALATNLHQELIERHSLDRRWAIKRTKFLKQRGVIANGITWPF